MIDSNSTGKTKTSGKRILVTGGVGFIGANLVRLLLDRGYSVTVLDNLSTGRREYLQGLPIELMEGDILDVPLVEQAVAGQDGVIHLAAQTGVPGSLADPRQDCEVNVIGTLNLLEALRAENRGRGGKEGDGVQRSANSVPRFIFASSNASLGRQPPPASEDKAPLPISPYGASKLAAEAYCLAYHGSWGLKTVALRFANVYGPFSAHKNSVVASFFKDLLTKGRVTIDGDGKQTRDFIYVGDVSRAILMALQKDLGGEVFQIATGVEVSIQELAASVQEAAEKRAEVQYCSPRQGDIRKNFSDISKAEKLLGWTPEVNLPEGLGLTYRWFLGTTVTNS